MKIIEVLNVIEKRKTAIFFSFILFFILSAIVSAQKNNMRTTITGSVVDASLYPVPGAVVLIDGQISNSITDSEGKYKIRTKKSAEKICILSHENGFIEVPINGMTRINFQFGCDIPLKPQNLNIVRDNDMVNIGYNTINKEQLTTQVIKINETSAEQIPYLNLYEMIQEKIPGVHVKGNDIILYEPDYYIRPVPSLLIVDGVNVNSLSGIPPSAVSSIEVLKNTSTTIYGTRGYGGAIIITTRTGNK